MVKAKFNQDDDPFKEVPTPKCFMRGSERARQTLGQVVSYATAHLISFAPTCFLFSFFTIQLGSCDHCDGNTLGLLSEAQRAYAQRSSSFFGDSTMPMLWSEATTLLSLLSNLRRWRRNFFLTSFSLLLTLATRIFQIARAVKPGALRHTDLEKSMLRLWNPNMRYSPPLRFSISLLCSIIAT